MVGSLRWIRKVWVGVSERARIVSHRRCWSRIAFASGLVCSCRIDRTAFPGRALFASLSALGRRIYRASLMHGREQRGRIHMERPSSRRQPRLAPPRLDPPSHRPRIDSPVAGARAPIQPRPALAWDGGRAVDSSGDVASGCRRGGSVAAPTPALFGSLGSRWQTRFHLGQPCTRSQCSGVRPHSAEHATWPPRGAGLGRPHHSASAGRASSSDRRARGERERRARGRHTAVD